MITLGLLKTELPEFLANSSLGSRINEWVYWVLTDILSGPTKFWWNKKQANLTTTDGTSEYFLTHRVNGWDVLWMGDTARTGIEIYKTNLETIYRFDSTPTDEGDPVYWAPVEMAEVQASNTATTSSAVSTSASDLSITVLIRGLVSSKERYETITLNGTTTATPSSPLTWDADSVTSVTLSAAPIGAVSVTIGNVVAIIPPGHQRIQTPRIRLWRVPGETLTLPYIYYQRALKPVADSDIVDVPDAGMTAIFEGVLYWGYKNNGDVQLAQGQWDKYLSAKDQLRSWSQNEISRTDRKFWPQSFADIPVRLPRTITGTVT